MKRILVLLSIVILLGGGGVGAAYFFVPSLLGIHNPADESEEVAAEVKPEPVAAPIKPLTIRMPTIDVPLVMGDVISRRVYFDVILIVEPEMYDKAQATLPRLRNAFIEFAYSAFPKQYKKAGKMNLPKLRFSLRKIAKSTLGADVVKDVLIQGYLER